ncbi:MAG: hydrogenase maturation nickel metallochaperone HypA [Chloroflexi bacterium]|nr:hydrogenase maturation nickel metallochaperone HypA [Chloroflexota bacterium]
MHELAVTQSVLEIVVRHAQRAQAARVTAINLVVGELSGFVSESIQFYFDMVSQGTPAEGAELRIRRVAAKVRCRACGTEFATTDHRWVCPQCQAVGGQVLSGQEFHVESIEVV